MVCDMRYNQIEMIDLICASDGTQADVLDVVVGSRTRSVSVLGALMVRHEEIRQITYTAYCEWTRWPSQRGTLFTSSRFLYCDETDDCFLIMRLWIRKWVLLPSIFLYLSSYRWSLTVGSPHIHQSLRSPSSITFI